MFDSHDMTFSTALIYMLYILYVHLIWLDGVITPEMAFKPLEGTFITSYYLVTFVRTNSGSLQINILNLQ